MLVMEAVVERTLADRVSRELQARGWDQKDLAAKMSRSASWVSDLVNGNLKRVPDPDALLRLEELLGITESEVLRAFGYRGGDPLEDRSLDEAKVYTYIEGNDDLTPYQKAVILQALDDVRRRRREMNDTKTG